MRQARCRDNFVRGIGLEVERPKAQADWRVMGQICKPIHGSPQASLSRPYSIRLS
jgi:hypothetical protein